MNFQQKKLLQMFKWFNNLCETNHLTYYALGGTMLGAIRHQGFIPWDDDMDIGLPREDYEKLITFIGDKKVSNYYLETPNSPSSDYRYPYSKLYDTSTTLTENLWPSLKRGIFIDIFPLDNLGNSKKEALNNWNNIFKKSNFVWARTCSLNSKRGWFKNLAILLAHLLPINDKNFINSLNDRCKELSQKYTVYGGNTFGNWGKKEIMPLEIMGIPKKYIFEDTFIYGVKDYEDYLTRLYGDWRELPSKEKRVSHHDYLELDLNKSYLAQ